ncbi:MAG: hypothetical protein MJ211_03650 [Bacteroidales bacterium]|nr:hypothetical protein [Bacteroidales bacterium]
MESTVDINVLRINLAREILSQDLDCEIVEKVSKFLTKLKSQKHNDVDYYESEQFYKDLEEGHAEFERGECFSVKSKQEIHDLIWG